MNHQSPPPPESVSEPASVPATKACPPGVPTPGRAGAKAGKATAPTCMADASTHSSLLGYDSHVARRVYYQGPVRDCLLRLGCPAADADGITLDLLNRIQTNILLGYDRSRPFRPYLQQAIRTWYLGLLRRRKQAMPQQVDGDGSAPMDASPEDGLVDFARQGYHIFAEEADASLRMGIAMLESWIIDEVDQCALAKHWNLTDRQVRTWLGRTADQLATWMHAHLHEQDLQELAARARAQGRNLELDPGGLRRMFSHLSQQKRTNALLILSLIMQRDRSEGESAPPT